VLNASRSDWGTPVVAVSAQSTDGTARTNRGLSRLNANSKSNPYNIIEPHGGSNHIPKKPHLREKQGQSVLVKNLCLAFKRVMASDESVGSCVLIDDCLWRGSHTQGV
jgi:hypothetical protein